MLVKIKMKESEIKQIIKDYYKDFAEGYGDEYTTTLAGRYFLKEKTKHALKFAKFKKTDKILDIGCANGYYIFYLNKLGYNITGSDLSPECINVCKKRAEEQRVKIDFVCTDVEDLKFKDNSFDGLISFSTLRYLPDMKKALSEIRRVVKPSGTILIDFPNKHSPWFLTFQKLATKYKLPHDQKCDKYYSANELKKIFKQAGFKKIEIKAILFIARTVPKIFTPLCIVVDQIGNNLPLINKLGGAILVKATNEKNNS